MCRPWLQCGWRSQGWVSESLRIAGQASCRSRICGADFNLLESVWNTETRHDKDNRNQRGKHNGVGEKRTAVCLSMRHGVAPIDFIPSPGIIHGAFRPLLHYLYGLTQQASRIFRGISTILAGPSNPIRTRYFGRSHQNLTIALFGARSAGSAVRGARFSTGAGEWHRTQRRRALQAPCMTPDVFVRASFVCVPIHTSLRGKRYSTGSTTSCLIVERRETREDQKITMMLWAAVTW